MRNIVLITILIATAISTFAQKSAGQIIYERKTDWVKIRSKATYLSQEEKDRMAQTWKNDTEYKQKMVLDFNDKTSYYTFQDQQEQSEDGTYSWRNDEYRITRDFENEKLLEIHEMLGKTYILEDSLKMPKWKVLNDIKEVAGYICMKASMVDTVKNQKIIAWFSTEIPVSSGPERFYGLPGMILETDIDEGAIVLTATSIIFNPAQEIPKLPKKLKGKKIALAAYNDSIYTYIKQQESLHRFPWGIRY
ncbi:GLPGLI family protein [Lacihabitans sp. LS3-19]|uniref:GLPGLI family protein n=1 Tax=Lacihabitans sp. LS3-19 TaxID=2487335 RepID=UPI0020CE7E20|nr:GLPGLI family protein [Lacihabitans sp. LS3-19]MCP9769652.1 GLPGLI family protein [Lacihabitans sp. LS3-19]